MGSSSKTKTRAETPTGCYRTEGAAERGRPGPERPRQSGLGKALPGRDGSCREPGRITGRIPRGNATATILTGCREPFHEVLELPRSLPLPLAANHVVQAVRHQEGPPWREAGRDQPAALPGPRCKWLWVPRGEPRAAALSAGQPPPRVGDGAAAPLPGPSAHYGTGKDPPWLWGGRKTSGWETEESYSPRAAGPWPIQGKPKPGEQPLFPSSTSSTFLKRLVLGVTEGVEALPRIQHLLPEEQAEMKPAKP